MTFKKRNQKMEHEVYSFINSRADNTARLYSRCWKDWIGYLKAKRIRKPKTRDCQQYLAQKKLADATIRAIIASLKSCYGYLMTIGKIERNPWIAAKYFISPRQKTQKRPTARLDSETVAKILAKYANPKSHNEARKAAILYLLFGSGLRRSEAIKLNLGDIQLDNDTLVLSLKDTKSGITQKQPISDFAAPFFLKIVTSRRLEGATDDDPIFVTHGNRMSESTLYRDFRDALKELNIKAAPHAARAAYCTNLLEKGATYEDAAAALRHKNLHTVAVYDKRRIKPTDLKAIKLSY